MTPWSTYTVISGGTNLPNQRRQTDRKDWFSRGIADFMSRSMENAVARHWLLPTSCSKHRNKYMRAPNRKFHNTPDKISVMDFIGSPFHGESRPMDGGDPTMVYR